MSRRAEIVADLAKSMRDICEIDRTMRRGAGWLYHVLLRDPAMAPKVQQWREAVRE